jgi:hypothetical protein
MAMRRGSTEGRLDPLNGAWWCRQTAHDRIDLHARGALVWKRSAITRFAARTSCVTQLQYHLRLAERRCFPRRDAFGLARLAVARFEARVDEVLARARLAIFFRPRVVVLLLPRDALFFLVATAAFFLPPDVNFFLAGVILFAALLDRGLLSAGGE